MIFDALDETIRIIRKTEGKADAAEKLIEALRARRRSRSTRSSSSGSTGWRSSRSWSIREELEAEARGGQARSRRSSRRQAQAAGSSSATSSTSSQATLRRQAPHEDWRRGDETRVRRRGRSSSTRTRHVVLTRDGWVKRVREVKDLRPTRLREGDAVLAVVRRLDQGGGRVLLEPRRVLRRPHQRRAGDDRLRRPGAEAVQVRDGERIVGALSARRARRQPPEEALAVRGRRKRRLRPPLQRCAAPRAVDARRPPLRASRTRATRSSASRA